MEPTSSTVATPAHIAEQGVERLIKKAETFSHDDPAKALAIAFGAGVLLNILPTRFIIGTAVGLTTLALRPTLMTLGVVKAFEIYTSQTKNHSIRS